MRVRCRPRRSRERRLAALDRRPLASPPGQLVRALILSLSVFVLAGCGHRRTENPAGADGVLDCTSVAGGEDCEVRACMECLDFCGLDCGVVQGDPTQYTCPGIGAYTILDTCPPPADDATIE